MIIAHVHCTMAEFRVISSHETALHLTSLEESLQITRLAESCHQMDCEAHDTKCKTKRTLQNCQLVLPASDSIVPGDHAGALGICASAPCDLWGGCP